MTSFSTAKPQSARQQATMACVDRLAQPKGQHIFSKAHVRRDRFAAMPARALVDNFQHGSAQRQKSTNAYDDQRFHELVNIFSDVYRRPVTDVSTVQSVIRSNSSLQDSQGRWSQTRRPNPCSNEFHHRTRLQLLKRNLSIMEIDV
jgi:hypothetical protein